VAEDEPVGPVTAYGASKAAAAVVAGWYGARLPVTLLRLFNVYGEGEPLPRLGPAIVDGARRGRPVPLTACRQVRDMTYAGDVAEAFWRAAAGPPETDRLRVLNVGTGTPVVLERYVAALAAELEGRGLPPVLRIGALPYRPDEAMTYLPAVGRLRDTLGWLPPTTLAQGLARMVDGW
jgi:nucleoside-diphosphate-sugar epimerase